MILYYVLFPNHDNGMRLYKEMKASGMKCTIVPTPREASKCCGISLLVEKENLEQIQQIVREKQIEILQIAEIKKDIDPNRDRYC